MLDAGENISICNLVIKKTGISCLFQNKVVNLPSQVSLDVAMDMFYHSDTMQLMEEGVADLHCRSDKYLAEKVWREQKS